MSRYRKVSVFIWNDRKFNRISDDAQLVFFFILTHPHMTSIGAMRTTIEGLSAEKNWPFERLSKAFFELEKEGMIQFDKTAKCLTLPNFIKHNKPESPNVIKGWCKALDLIPECELKYKQLENVTPFVHDMGEKFIKPFESLLKAFGKAFRKNMPNQEQEQEQDIVKKNIQKKKPKKQPRQTRKTSIPKDYSLTDRHIHYADSKGMSYEIIKHEFEGFCIYHRQKGSKFVDWYAAWQTWVRNYFTFGKDQNEKTAMASNNLPEVTGSLYAN